MAASADKSIFTRQSSPAEPEIHPTPAHPHVREPKAAAIRSLDILVPAGRLEALLNEGQPGAPFAALVCHPHPKGGGTMHNKVVYHAAKVFSSLGWPVLRFNFRGTGLSEGEHDGRAEVDDVRAALTWLENEYTKPIVAAGFSFGSAMGLEACCNRPGVLGFAALGLPVEAAGREYRFPFLTTCTLPKLFLSGGQDQFAPEAKLRAAIALAADPKELVILPGADHFFTGHMPAMQSALAAWLASKFTA